MKLPQSRKFLRKLSAQEQRYKTSFEQIRLVRPLPSLGVAMQQKEVGAASGSIILRKQPLDKFWDGLRGIAGDMLVKDHC